MICWLGLKCVCVCGGVCCGYGGFVMSMISLTLHIGSIGIPFIVSGVSKSGIIGLNVFH